MSVLLDFPAQVKVPYALRRVPAASLRRVLPRPAEPEPGDLALARVEKIGKNTALELSDGRRCALHVGDLVAVAFGNRYATQQFEGYARCDGDRCDLLSMGGLCGLVHTKHAGVSEPSKLVLLGTLGDARGRPLRLGDHGLPPVASAGDRPRILVVCGTSMDAGKTYTAMSLIRGLRRGVDRVAGIKLTGTATGKDTWSMLDAGACVALDFVDGGLPSTHLCSTDRLLDLHDRLVGHALSRGAEWVVVEVADGLMQRETSGLLQSARFRAGVDAWVFAAGDPLAGIAGVAILRRWGIEPVALSGLLSQSPLGMREAGPSTGVPCLTARELQDGVLNERLLAAGPPAPTAVAPETSDEAVRGEVLQVV
jgi:hypothetical protein